MRVVLSPCTLLHCARLMHTHKGLALGLCAALRTYPAHFFLSHWCSAIAKRACPGRNMLKYPFACRLIFKLRSETFCNQPKLSEFWNTLSFNDGARNTQIYKKNAPQAKNGIQLPLNSIVREKHRRNHRLKSVTITMFLKVEFLAKVTYHLWLAEQGYSCGCAGLS